MSNAEARIQEAYHVLSQEAKGLFKNICELTSHSIIYRLIDAMLESRIYISI